MASVILKATEACNSNCYYCDVVRKEGTGSTMSLEVLETVLKRIDEYLVAWPQEEIELLWHGGEPLLLGVKYYETVVDLQRRLCSRTQERIRHAFQTNLTCFHEGFVDVFRQLGITCVGTSYDPEPHVRGPGTHIDTDAYNRNFMKALHVLERSNIGWGMIYVVTKKSLRDPLGVFYHLTNLLLSGGVNMNPVLIYDEERKDIAVSPEEYVDFLGAIFPSWWKHRDRYPNINPFWSIASCIIDKNTTLGCVESGECTYRHINIAPDGETSQCGRSSDWKLLSYGNVSDHTLEEILADDQRAQLAERVRVIHDTDCKGCRFWDICHGGCPLDSWSKHGNFMHKSEWCQARRGFIEKYFEPITEVRFEPRTT